MQFWPLTPASFAASDMTYPTAFYYLVGVGTAGACALGAIDPPVAPASNVLVLARMLSAAAGVAAVGAIGLVGLRMGGRAVGLTAAALMAVAPFVVMHAHLASVDELLVLWTVLAILAAFRLAREPSMLGAAVAGAMAGAGFATKYTALALAVPVGWAVGEAAWARRRPITVVRLAVAAVCGFAAAVVALCPPCIARWDLVATALQYHRDLANRAELFFPGNHLAPSLGWYGRPYAYQLVASLPFVLGWPLYLLALAGFVLALRRRDAGDRIVLATLLPYFVAIGGWSATFPRQLEPLVPGLVVLAARAASARPRAVWVAVCAAVWLYTTVLAATHVARFSTVQQHDVARWIATNVRSADGMSIRVAAPTIEPTDYYQLRNALVRAGLAPLNVGDVDWLRDRPDAFVLPAWLRMTIRRDRPESAAAAELERLDRGATGYRLARAWHPSWYFDRSSYVRLDPAFQGDLWEGEIGFDVYVRGTPSEKRASGAQSSAQPSNAP
jgi:4-amino-4-deoxy-L-arabinose transferase-like glycosyltransferase